MRSISKALDFSSVQSEKDSSGQMIKCASRLLPIVCTKVGIYCFHRITSLLPGRIGPDVQVWLKGKQVDISLSRRQTMMMRAFHHITSVCRHWRLQSPVHANVPCSFLHLRLFWSSSGAAKKQNLPIPAVVPVRTGPHQSTGHLAVHCYLRDGLLM